MKFAFWNVHQNPVINHYIVDLIYENELDIIVLAEYKDNEQKLIDELTQKGIYMEKYLTSGCDRIMTVSYTHLGQNCSRSPLKLRLWMRILSFVRRII